MRVVVRIENFFSSTFRFQTTTLFSLVIVTNLLQITQKIKFFLDYLFYFFNLLIRFF